MLELDSLKDAMNLCFRPDEKAEVFYKQMVAQLHHVLENEKFGDGLYIHGPESDFALMCAFQRHLRYLRTLPNNDLYAVKIIIDAQQRSFEPWIRAYTEEVEIRELCESADEMMLEVVEKMIGQQEQDDQYERMVSVMEDISTAYARAGRMIQQVPRKEPFEGNSSFRHSMIALANWHSKHVAPMLAQKVAGNELPSELVEMIFESYTLIKTAERSAALQKLKDEEYAQSIERFWASMSKSVSSRP